MTCLGHVEAGVTDYPVIETSTENEVGMNTCSVFVGFHFNEILRLHVRQHASMYKSRSTVYLDRKWIEGKWLRRMEEKSSRVVMFR